VPVSHSFETAQTSRTIMLALGPDALAVDNEATLAPVSMKEIRVSALALAEATDSVRRAVRAIPYTIFTESTSEAHLVFSAARDYVPSPRNLRLCILPYLADANGAEVAGSKGGEESNDGKPSAPVAEKTRLAQGRDIVADHKSPVVNNLSLEGVLWPCLAQWSPGNGEPGQALLAMGGLPLLTLEPLGGNRARYAMNLLWDRTNIFRHAAWPMLVQGMVEECREAIPGLTRSNFRLGEEVPLHLEADPALPASFDLKREGALQAHYGELPELLGELPAGHYQLVQGGKRALAEFCVNFFAPAESDVSAVKPREANLAALASDSLNNPETSKPLYLVLILMLILVTALSWIFQDTSR
jgi:hypothetical protein